MKINVMRAENGKYGITSQPTEAIALVSGDSWTFQFAKRRGD